MITTILTSIFGSKFRAFTYLLIAGAAVFGYYKYETLKEDHARLLVKAERLERDLKGRDLIIANLEKVNLERYNRAQQNKVIVEKIYEVADTPTVPPAVRTVLNELRKLHKPVLTADP